MVPARVIRITDSLWKKSENQYMIIIHALLNLKNNQIIRQTKHSEKKYGSKEHDSQNWFGGLLV